jgi:hypothetical protein
VGEGRDKWGAKVGSRRKKAYTTCGSNQYKNDKKNDRDILIIRIHLATRFLQAKFRGKNAYVTNLRDL